MAVDPNDMLIFKMRGMQFGKAAGAKPAPRAPVIEGVRVPTAAIPSEEREEVGKAFAARATEEMGEAIAPEVAAEREAVGLGYLEEQRRTLRGFIAEEEKGAEEAPKKKGGKKKTAKEEIAAAKGLTCVNHPWRPAYAVCDYCGRAWCYSDLVNFEGRFYCLEDIDEVSKEAAGEIKVTKHNTFEMYAGIVFLVYAIALSYFTYPQWSLLIAFVGKVGVSGLLSHLSTNYGAFLFNIFVVALGAVAALSLLTRAKGGYYLSTLAGVLSIVLVTYEFLTSNATYLLAILVLAFAGIVVLAFSRMTAARSEKTEVFSEPQPLGNEIEWPRLETF